MLIRDQMRDQTRGASWFVFTFCCSEGFCVFLLMSSAPITGEYTGRILSEEERSKHGSTGYRKQLQQQSMTSQLHQKPGGACELASPDSVSRLFWNDGIKVLGKGK